MSFPAEPAPCPFHQHASVALSELIKIADRASFETASIMNPERESRHEARRGCRQSRCHCNGGEGVYSWLTCWPRMTAPLTQVCRMVLGLHVWLPPSRWTALTTAGSSCLGSISGRLPGGFEGLAGLFWPYHIPDPIVFRNIPSSLRLSL